MYRKIKNTAITIFLICVVVLTLVAVLAIWDVFGNETLWKSISTVGVLAFATLITIGAAGILENRSSSTS